MTRLPLALACLILPALLVKADDPPKPNALTPQEIADGWLLLFDGETTFGWKVEGDVKVKDGALVVGKNSTLYPTTDFGPDPRLHLEVRGRCEVHVGNHVLRVKNPPRWTDIVVDSGGGFNRIVADTDYAEAKTPRPELARSPVAIVTDGDSTAEVRSVKLKPLGLKPLFNGKDLSGWKVFAGEKYKSVFSVTKEGWLNVKNGPGDLQTEGKYADFVLQFDCISNGKALNSGVFFRCLPDQYQNGYEAQIQNGFKDNDRTKPADFGTGAIYRRVPARKVVPNDFEWFTMTVAARGNHLATWVNGYQTVDWTDDRPPNDNPRQGSKTGAGHVSIQGHDPTTDLSFRNLRLAELKK